MGGSVRSGLDSALIRLTGTYQVNSQGIVIQVLYIYPVQESSEFSRYAPENPTVYRYCQLKRVWLYDP